MVGDPLGWVLATVELGGELGPLLGGSDRLGVSLGERDESDEVGVALVLGWELGTALGVPLGASIAALGELLGWDDGVEVSLGGEDGSAAAEDGEELGYEDGSPAADDDGIKDGNDDGRDEGPALGFMDG